MLEDLRHACRTNNHDKTRKILVSSLNRWGEERVRSMLHAEDAEGNTVLKLASNASGENATGDSTLKVMLLSCSRHGARICDHRLMARPYIAGLTFAPRSKQT